MCTSCMREGRGVMRRILSTFKGALIYQENSDWLGGGDREVVIIIN